MISVKEHWRTVASLPCMVSARPGVTLHHCHGGSMIERGVARGMGQKVSDYLVIPLHAEYHTGNYGIDSGMGVDEWEALFGNQADMLDHLCEILGYDVWELAGVAGKEG